MITALGLLFAVAAPAASASLSLSAPDGVVGQPIQASAQLSESPAASGEISFEVFGPGITDCSGTALAPAPASAMVNGEGEYVSGDFTPPAAGTYSWSAHYLGDEVNPPADSNCSISTVGRASPGLTGAASDGAVGTAIHDEATLTGGFSPSGEVTFSVYGPADSGCSTSLKTESVQIQGGLATAADFLSQQAGEFRWKATYLGDANNQPVSLGCGAANQASNVSKASPTLTGVATAAVNVGQPITDSATLAGGFAAGGQLVFRAYGPDDQTCAAAHKKYEEAVTVSGDGSYSPVGFSPGPGAYRWTVEYQGDSNNEPVSLGCGAANQASNVSKALPNLEGMATSVVKAGLTITDSATLSGGFGAGGKLIFRAYGPDDQTCVTTAKYEKAVTVSGDNSYSPAGFAPAVAGLYRWTVEYGGDANNEAVLLGCNAANQGSAVGMISLVLAASATSATVGTPVTATATLQEGAIPGGQVTFKAFPPGDPTCSGAAVFSSVVNVAGNGSYRSAAFVPSLVGSFRWTVAYSGDVNHNAAAVGCGKAASSISLASPTIVGSVKPRLAVGTSFRDTVVLQGGYAPGGTITFRVYGPVASGCAKPLFVDTVPVTSNGTFRSDPFAAQRTGRYSFVASYSGDVANNGVTEPCDSPGQAALVLKRTPKVKPLALLMGRKLIAIRAHLSGAASPSGAINFRLYGPGDKRCKRKPAFNGSIAIKKNGSYALAKYLATRAGIYRLSVGYSGDKRNQPFKGSCAGAQSIRVG